MKTPEKNPHAVHRGKLGGLAAAAALTPEERKVRAAKAGKNAPGWPKGKPRGPRTNWGNK